MHKEDQDPKIYRVLRAQVCREDRNPKIYRASAAQVHREDRDGSSSLQELTCVHCVYLAL